MAKTFGIDLGTANTLICHKQQIILRAPSIAVVSEDDREVVALGKSARSMLGKTPEGLSAVRPLKGGVITDYEIATKMVRGFLEQVNAFSIFSRPSIIVCVPYKASPVERRALEDVIFDAGARSVALIDEPLAAALGTGLRVGANRGSMIMDIGGGSSEVAVISNGGIVASSSVRVAGDSFDSAIVEYVKSKRNALIGEATAEQIKLKCGAAHPAFDSGEMQVAGRNLLSGMGCILTVTSGEIREAISPSLEKIVNGVKETLEQTPPELAADVYDYGIMLTGGSSRLRGLALTLQERLGIRVTAAKHPFDAVCMGIMRVIESEGRYGNLLRYRAR